MRYELNGKVALVTGATSGIGLAFAQALEREGCRVYGGARHGKDISGVTFIGMDVRSEDSVDAAVEGILAAEGRIDILVSCAGMGVSGPVEQLSDGYLVEQFDVNLFGSMRVAKAVMPSMRGAGAGRIILTGSVAGRIPIPFQGAYSASKAAIASMARCISMEAKAYGIQCTVVEPGDIHTGFTDARKKEELPADSPYSAVCDKAVSTMEHDEINGTAPWKLASEVIRRTLKRRKMPARYVPGFSYKALTFLTRLLPEAAVGAIVAKMYMGGK